MGEKLTAEEVAMWGDRADVVVAVEHWINERFGGDASAENIVMATYRRNVQSGLDATRRPPRSRCSRGVGMGLAERIDAELAGRAMSFHDLALRLFPDPRSWRYSSNGGPPGCFMTLSATLRRGGFPTYRDGPGSGHRKVYPRPSPAPSEKQ